MKFSELSTDRALDVMCELTPYIDNIVNDQNVTNTIGKVVVEKGKELNKYGIFMLTVGRLSESIPLLLRTHRPDVYGILSILNEKTTDEIAAQPAMSTLRQFREAFNDEELTVFFKSFTQREQTEQSAPSAGSHASE